MAIDSQRGGGAWLSCLLLALPMVVAAVNALPFVPRILAGRDTMLTLRVGAVLGILALCGALAAWTGSRRVGVLAAALALVGGGLVLWLGVIDDAYISLRYARNFAAGDGLVFNPGERVEGYTCFLWVLGLGLAARLSQAGGLPLLAAIGSVGFGVATVLLLARFVARQERGPRPWTAALPVLFVASYPLLFWSFSGMETTLFLTLLLGGGWALQTALEDRAGRAPALAAGTLLGLAALTRPETYLILAFALAWLVAVDRRLLSARTLAFALPVVALLVPHLLWRLSYYGHPLPNTYYAKVGTPLAHAGFGLEYLFTGLLAHLWILPFAALRVLRPDVSAVRRLFPLSMLCLLAVIIVITGADHFGEWRFMLYMWPFLFLLAAPEIVRAVDSVAGLVGRPGVRRALRAALVAVLCVSAFVGVFYFDGRGPVSAGVTGARLARNWAEVGRWIEANTEESAVVAAPAIGAIGYYSGRTIVDLLGLVDPTIARGRRPPAGGPKDHDRFDSEYVMARQPDVIFLATTARTERDFLEADHWLPAIRDLKRHFPNDCYAFRHLPLGPRGFGIYLRRCEPAASGIR